MDEIREDEEPALCTCGRGYVGHADHEQPRQRKCEWCHKGPFQTAGDYVEHVGERHTNGLAV